MGSLLCSCYDLAPRSTSILRPTACSRATRRG